MQLLVTVIFILLFYAGMPLQAVVPVCLLILQQILLMILVHLLDLLQNLKRKRGKHKKLFIYYMYSVYIIFYLLCYNDK